MGQARSSPACRQLQDHEHPIFQTRDFLVDVVGASLASVIAVRSAAIWAASLASCQWLGVLSRIAPILDATVHRRATITAEYLWETGAVISLAGGVVVAFLAKRQSDHVRPKSDARKSHVSIQH